MKDRKTSIGLALSGGGYKGIAHAGVLHFLEEQGITINQLAGTSAGAIVGALYLKGIRPLEILEFFKSVSLFNWHHFTLRKAGLMDANSFDVYLKEIFEDTTLGDLKTPLFITATNMENGKLEVFEPETKIVDALLASSAFPGIFSPYKIGDTIYSDGGILNNFPTNLLHSKNKYIIGVNVCPLQEIHEEDLQSIRAVTVRAYELMTTLNNRQKGLLCDWLIEPKELADYATFERSKLRMNEIFELGYSTAKESFMDKAVNFEKAVL